NSVTNIVTHSATNSVWKYRDTGENLGTAWTGLTFNDSAWKSGPSMLGYGDGGEATVVSYGPDPNGKYFTTYFRRAFTILDPTVVSALAMQVRREDGVIVYLNGSEIYRNNMPTGPVNYLTPAATGASDKTTFH